MVSNFDLSKSWMQMAVEDFLTAKDAKTAGRRGIAVYHIQQCVEKLCKALLAFFGREPRKNHFPSYELGEILREDLETELMTEIKDELFKNEQDSKSKEGREMAQLLKSSKAFLQEIILLARSTEDEVTRPRYGVRHSTGIILPQVLYTNEQVNLFFDDLNTIIQLLKEIFTLRKNAHSSTLLDILKLFEGENRA